MFERSRKIYPSQASLEYAGVKFKHVVVALSGDQTIAGVFETPDVWVNVQTGMRLSKGDRVTIVAADGNAIADQAMVVKAEAGQLWFSKPLRVVALDEVALFSDGVHRVVAVGTGYSVSNIRNGRIGDRIFHSEEAAKAEILKRQPSKVA